jgi:hypothetical protein
VCAIVCVGRSEGCPTDLSDEPDEEQRGRTDKRNEHIPQKHAPLLPPILIFTRPFLVSVPALRILPGPPDTDDAARPACDAPVTQEERKDDAHDACACRAHPCTAHSRTGARAEYTREAGRPPRPVSRSLVTLHERALEDAHKAGERG